MDLELIKVLSHPFFHSAFSEGRIAFSTSRKIYLYDFTADQELSIIDQVTVRNVDVFEFNKNGDILYILDTQGRFYLYDINSKKLTYKNNKMLSGECFGNISVLENSDCLWCSGSALFRYSNKEERIEKIFQSSYTLKNILSSSTEFLYLTAFSDNNLYIIKFSLINMNIVNTVSVKGYHKIKKVWHSQEFDKFFIIKGNKLMCIENSNDFRNDEVKIVYKMKDFKKAIHFKESQNGKLIAFSNCDSLSVLDISKNISVFFTQNSSKANNYIRNIAFAFKDKYIAVSYDNFDYGGKTYFYKCAQNPNQKTRDG